MTIIDETPPPPALPPSAFNPLDAAIGVITRPAAAMRAIAAARPWLIALVLSTVIALLGSLATLTAPPQDMRDLGTLPQELRPVFESLAASTRNPAILLGTSLVLNPLGLLIGSGFYWLIGRMLGGRGPFSSMVATQGFAAMPSLLSAPLVALLGLGGANFAPLTGLVGFAVFLWTLVLSVLGIRESLALSTGRAVATIGILLVIGLLLLCVVGILVAVLAVSATGGAR